MITLSLEQPPRSPLGRFKFMKSAVIWADEVGPIIRSRLRDEAPKRTGRLARSIRYERLTSGVGTVRLEFKAYTPYARFVISGTKAHTITPQAARALHWTSNSGSHFAQVVNHPGTRPNDFPRRTELAAVALIANRFNEIMSAAFR